MKRGDVFVIGGVHHNILGVIRSLGERNIRPYVIVESTQAKRPYICRSRYIRKFWIAESAEDVLVILKREASKLSQKPVLIICSDNLASIVDLNYDELSKYLLLPGAEDQGRVTHYMDKEVMSSFAKEVGFQVPPSFPVSDIKSEEEDIPISFPWIVKPLVSKNGGKYDIKRIYNKGEWDCYRKEHDTPVQVQKLVEKDYEYQLLGLSLNNGRDVIIPGCCYCLRPSETSNTGFVHFVNLDSLKAEIVALGKRFIKEIGYSGLFSLEFLHSKDGGDYFLEMNFRNDGNAYCVTKAGVNLPYIWVNRENPMDLHNEIDKDINEVYLLPVFFELSMWGKGLISFRTLMADIKKADFYADYSSDDPKPTYGRLRFYARFVKLLFMKCRNYFH